MWLCGCLFLPKDPGPVDAVTWLPQGESSVNIKWAVPNMANGVITGFIVRLSYYASNDLVQSQAIGASNVTVYMVSFSNSTLGEASSSSHSSVFLPPFHVPGSCWCSVQLLCHC